jgi:hypothetical protein
MLLMMWLLLCATASCRVAAGSLSWHPASATAAAAAAVAVL